MELINLRKQYQLYRLQIDEAIKNVLESGQYIMGRAINDMEATLAEFIGVKRCIATSSGTDSLLLALKSLDIGPGDEVICVPYTWVSPVECIKRLGARPVLIDIDPETCLMDINLLEEAITERTKAILPISLYGQMPDFDKLMDIAQRYQIPVVEDGAQSFGAKQKGRYSCSITTIGVTSFFPTKPLGCYGDGGAIFTNREDLADKIQALRTHGASVRYQHQYVGMNGRMDTLQAAIILAKFPFFKEELIRREAVGNFYNENLKDEFRVPKIIENNTHIFAQYALQSDKRELVLNKLKNQNIAHAVYYPICIHEQPAYSDLNYPKGSFPHAENVSKKVFSIPMHPWLEEEDQIKVIQVLKDP